MKKFEFRTEKVFESSYEYDHILAVIDRVRTRCPKYRIYESHSGHSANAFDEMALGVNEGETYLTDDHMLFYDAADNLLTLNQSLGGDYGWDKIADIVGTRTGVDFNNCPWVLRTYQLKPEFSQILIDNLNNLEQEIRANYEMFLLEEKKSKNKREAIKQSIFAIETTEKMITDEGGKTKEYIHTITFHDGEKLTFIERNLFDVGVVINPSYSISQEIESGGLCMDLDGIKQWYNFTGDAGWQPVRELTVNEITALEYLHIFGGFSGARTRI